jgi:hypothetical protein
MQEASSAADNPEVEEAMQRSLADYYSRPTELEISSRTNYPPRPPYRPLTDGDARRILQCLQENSVRFDSFTISGFRLSDAAVLNVLRVGLPMCTSVTTVTLNKTELGNDGLEMLLPAFCFILLETIFKDNEVASCCSPCCLATITYWS